MDGVIMHHVALWTAAFLTLGIISFLYRDNAWYKFCEAVFIGISAGYWFVSYFWDNLYGKLWLGIFPTDPTQPPDYILLIGGALGVMMLLRLIPKIGWLSRWPLAFIVGATAGLNLIIYFASNVMVQVEDTIRPLFGANYAASAYDIVGNIVVAVGTFTALIYFFFSKEHKGAFGGAAKVGIFVLMVTFGASFGYTVMSRISLLLGRIDFLMGDWLGVIK
ncbi:hypothetical protein C3F09_02215 [candidate division GN15 bacterium]|uniref:Uncharacterized protein n=1 Tax=candidate division GN15 bacterium TaxID=2072418 RepID=A0A855XC12_9BACT|nr:MAG: hypothetical protein C3F09_02215 [candidate division GN15 bacterium]